MSTGVQRSLRRRLPVKLFSISPADKPSQASQPPLQIYTPSRQQKPALWVLTICRPASTTLMGFIRP